jgi:hypothetical protein
MLMPLTEEEYEAQVPAWAKELDRRETRLSLIAGMRVYDVLYGGKYGRSPWGTVQSVSDDGTGAHVVHDDGCETAGAARYYVPVPDGVEPESGKSST